MTPALPPSSSLPEGHPAPSVTMKTWWPPRKALAAVAILSAIVTGSMGFLLGGAEWHAPGGAVYVLIAGLAAFTPAAVATQVIMGQVLVGSLLLGPTPTSPFLLAPMVGTIILTAELLAAVARMDTPMPKDPGDVLPRSLVAGLAGGVVFAVVVFLARLPGPAGFLGVALASAACVGLAWFLAGQVQGPERGDPAPPG